MKRTHYCGSITAGNIGEKVTLCGWVHSRRDHGGVIFIDLRDREGLVQIVFKSENKELLANAENLRSEYVLRVSGCVGRRPEGTLNPKLPTGEIEVIAEKLEILNTSDVLPFEISEFQNVGEENRLRYRYLDLRQKNLKQNIELRSKILQTVRKYFIDRKFYEIETPFLTKSTPEGARDFLVPSRLTPGAFYALPQSPQLFKQILMISGFDKYFQVVRCFRDEDLRADRQPEFTQIDVEMSFIEEDDIISVTENMIVQVFKDALGVDIKIPFKRLDYCEAISSYGSDKPDLRFEMEIGNLTDNLRNTRFKVFRDTIAGGGIVCGICADNSSNAFSRQQLDNLKEIVAPFGAKGLAWIKISSKGFESPIAKFLSNEELESIRRTFNAPDESIVFFVADKKSVVFPSLGALRVHLAKELKLLDGKDSEFAFTWVVNFPLLEYSDEEKKYVSMHHPFTLPDAAGLPVIDEVVSFEKLDLAKIAGIRARAYDIVLNGVELGGGSIRIHNSNLQKKIFKILSISDDTANERFGFLLEALKYGAPPHGGIALGFDRLMAILCGEDSIRDVIAFPKTQKGTCQLTNAPAEVSQKQLKELNIRLS